MSVCVDGACTRPVEVTSGVPQVSVLDPVLFLVYLNYVSHDLPCMYKAFVDDYKLYLKFSRKNGQSAIHGAESLQCDLNLVDAVSELWNRKFNSDKCVVMRFHRGHVHIDDLVPVGQCYLHERPLQFVASQRDLGM